MHPLRRLTRSDAGDRGGGSKEKVAPKTEVKGKAAQKTESKGDATPKAEPKAEVKEPLTEEESAKVIEKAIRDQLKKPTGEFTKADLEKVTELNLYNNQLTDVKRLEKPTQLTDLNLQDNQLTDVKGLEKLTRLTLLALSDNQLTDVKGLENLTQLESLYLDGNPDLNKAQIAELQKALPKCKIEHNLKN